MPMPRSQTSMDMEAWRERASGTAMVDLSNMFLNPTSSSAWSKPSLFTHGTRLADAPPKHYAEVQQPLHDLWDDYESMTPTERTAASTMMSRATSFSSVSTFSTPSSTLASSKQLEKLQPELKTWIPELCVTLFPRDRTLFTLGHRRLLGEARPEAQTKPRSFGFIFRHPHFRTHASRLSCHRLHLHREL